MKSGQHAAVALAMLWIGAMVILSRPEWIRAARDFVSTRTGHAPGPQEQPPSGGGGNAGRR